MALQEFDKTMNYIQNLDDNPNISGLSAQALKERFDKAGEDIKTYINTILTKQIDTQINNINARIDGFFPVGSIYMSVNNVNPSTIFGGTWEQIEDRFLLASGSTYGAGTTGGAATVTLTTNQIPSHSHNFGRYVPSSGAAWHGDDSNTLSGTAHTKVYANRGNISSITGTQSTGGGQAHNNMPPYLAVYVWKRVS
jgi:hypothetical protein